MISTPNAPGGLFERIEKESEETCLYKRLKLDYHYGLGKIYTQEEIDKARDTIENTDFNTKEYLAIPEQFDKLIISLRTAYANKYSLDKEQTSYSDSLDALRLACKMFRMK